MIGPEKYTRELYKLATQVSNLIEAAQKDLTLNRTQREDITFELVRAKSALIDCTAALVAIGQEDDKP